MKMSCDSHVYRGYPMSQFVGSISGCGLSYEARELACHSRDVYVKRLEGVFKPSCELDSQSSVI